MYYKSYGIFFFRKYIMFLITCDNKRCVIDNLCYRCVKIYYKIYGLMKQKALLNI